MSTRSVSSSRLPLSELFRDSFDRANGAIGNMDTGQSWVGSTWTISSNKAMNAPTLGATMVLNGLFTTDTANWTAINATLASVAGGVTGNCLKITNVGANFGTAYQAITTVVGQWYSVSVSYKNGTTTPSFGIGTSPGDTSIWIKGLSSASWTGRACLFKATTTTTYISVKAGVATDGLTILYDDILFYPVTLSKIMATVQTAVKDIELSVVEARGQTTQNGIILNLDSQANPQNFVTVLVESGSSYNRVNLEKCVNGVYTTVTSINVTDKSSAGVMVGVKKTGTSYQLYYNNLLLGAAQTISDTEIINNKIHGIFCPDVQSTMNNFVMGTGFRSAAGSRPNIKGKLPTSISGLVGWWKADSLVLNDGDVVDSWTDSSGNGNHLTGTTTQRPTFKTNLINSTYPLIRFNGTTNVLTKTGIVTANPFTIFAVGQAQNTIAQTGRMVAGNVSNWLMGIRSSLFQAFNNNFAASKLVPAINTPYLHIVTQAAGDLKQYLTFRNNAIIIDGVQTAANVAPNGIKVGGGSGEFMQVDIVEVIIFSSVLSLVNIQNISYYLGKKYNLVPINLSRSSV